MPVHPPYRRSAGVVVRALTLDRYADGLLREMAASAKGYGHLVSALILAEYARRQERGQSRLPGVQAQDGDPLRPESA